MAIRPVTVDERLTIYVGGGCNSVVLLSQNGCKALIVDTKYFLGARKFRELVTASDITVVNTHFHMDHARGNRLYPGAYVISGTTNWKLWDIDTGHSKRPDRALNPGESLCLEFEGECVHLVDVGMAHSWNDLFVYFENRRLLAAGDLVWVGMHPVLLDRHTSIPGWIRALERMQTDFDVQTVVPGHGDVSGKESISSMKTYFVSIMEAIGDHERMKNLKDRYKHLKRFPLFGSFGRTARFIKRDMRPAKGKNAS